MGQKMITLVKGDWWMRQRRPRPYSMELPHASDFAIFRLV